MIKRKTSKWYRNKIDKLRREYVKQKNQDWKGWGNCISCMVYRPVEELQVGHYYSRIHDWTTDLGLCEENTQLQCVPCNNYKRGNPQGYGMGLVRKGGVELLQKLEEAKKTPKRYTIADYEKLLEKYGT